jgi:hypothetical protein
LVSCTKKNLAILHKRTNGFSEPLSYLGHGLNGNLQQSFTLLQKDCCYFPQHFLLSHLLCTHNRSRQQGCQIFLGTIHQNEKLYDRKLGQISMKSRKSLQSVPSNAFKNIPFFFGGGMKIYHLATLDIS